MPHYWEVGRKMTPENPATPDAMKIGPRGIALIKKWEQCRLNAYDDGVGVWTIGYGHTLNVRKGDRISMEVAEQYLRDDLHHFERGVVNALKVDVKQSQFDAMVSLAFNIGVKAFETSTLLRLVNAGKHVEAAEQFRRWKKAGKLVLLGLVRRRAAEKLLYLEDL